MPLVMPSIVCAVDFSSFSTLVVRYGMALAQRAGGHLHLIHAVHDPQDHLHPTAEFERGGHLAQSAQDAKQQMQALMPQAAANWEAVVRFGEPVEQTVAFVNSLPSSLVVSASHGVSGFRRLFIGTVVERLTRAVDRPMLVVKPDDGQTDQRFAGFRSAVVGCDSRGHWQRLAPLMPLLQSDSTMRIHLVHALEAPLDNFKPSNDAAPYAQVQQALQDRLNRRLRQDGQRLFPHVDKLSVVVSPGVPQEMVLRVAREQAADLIVVGVRRSGKVGRWISGSTTETLLRRSSCCVLTLPESVKKKRYQRHHQ